jgi:hypothetical protein
VSSTSRDNESSDLAPQGSVPDLVAPPEEDVLPHLDVVNRGTLTSSVLGALPALLAVGEAVTGDVVEVVGPKFLQTGISDGSLRYIQAAQGSHLGTVVDSQSGRIVGQVQLSKSRLPATAAVAGAFQVASFVTGQYYLHAIDQRLAAIEGSLDRVAGRLEHRAAAEIDAAQHTVNELRRLLSAVGEFADRDWDRLAEAEGSARAAYFEELGIATELAEHIGSVNSRVRDALMRSGTAKPPKGLRALKSDFAALKSDSASSCQGLRRLLRAAHLVAEIALLRAVAESQRDHKRGDVLRSEARESLRSLAVDLGRLTELNALRGVSESDLSRLFAFDGKPTKGLLAFEHELEPVATAVLRAAQSLQQIESEDVEMLTLGA